MRPIIHIIALILISSINSFGGVLVKANVIRGESFVTVNSDVNEIEHIVKEALQTRGFEIAENIFEEEIALVDLFIYQYPATHPAITIIYRTTKGIHYFDNERIKLFGDRHIANLKILDKLMQRFPQTISDSIIFKPTVKDILSNNRVSLIGGVSNSITRAYRSNYESILTAPENLELPFFIPEGFIEYLNYCSSFAGFRKYIKKSPITVELRINETGRFELLDIQATFELRNKHKKQIEELIAAFPLWNVDKGIEPIELILSVN